MSQTQISILVGAIVFAGGLAMVIFARPMAKFAKQHQSRQNPYELMLNENSVAAMIRLMGCFCMVLPPIIAIIGITLLQRAAAISN